MSANAEKSSESKKESIQEELSQEDKKSKKNKRNFWLIALSVLFLIILLIWLIYWLLVGRYYIYTEDAYVHGNEVMLTPQVSAGVKAIYADETNLVQQGQLVVELDSSNYKIRIEELKRHLANEVRAVTNLFYDVEAKEAIVTLRKEQMKQAELDYQHRQPLVRTGAVSKEEFETYQTQAKVAEAQLLFAEKELQASKAFIEGTTLITHPRVQAAVWQLKQAYLNYVRCQIWAPVTGFVAKRSVQVGDQVQAGQTLLFIIPLDCIWVNANYKETQLGKLRIGQPVTLTADLYGRDVKYHGKVMGLQPGSGNAFALLPPENASGNWIKIIQRVPVRVSMQLNEIKKSPLLLGLSMRVTVDVHDTSGKTLAPEPTFEPLYTTSIYNQQMEDLSLIESMIDDVIKTNMYSNDQTTFRN